MRKRRKELATIDPLYPQTSVWVIEVNGKQYCLAGKKRDIQIKRIPKRDLRKSKFHHNFHTISSQKGTTRIDDLTSAVDSAYIDCRCATKWRSTSYWLIIVKKYY